MSPQRPEPGSPAHWLEHARSDMALAAAPRPASVLFGDLCFHAQQAAEKALKAVLVHRHIAPPRSHDLRHLLSLLPEGAAIPDQVRAAVILSQHATTSRYPDDSEDVDEPEWRDCVRLAAAVLAWAEAEVQA